MKDVKMQGDGSLLTPDPPGQRQTTIEPQDRSKYASRKGGMASNHH